LKRVVTNTSCCAAFERSEGVRDLNFRNLVEQIREAISAFFAATPTANAL
jgi:hypothetical protein